MGIRGLTSFFQDNPELFTDHRLHNCKVVIDGPNLLHFLYFGNYLDCMYGGDYNKFVKVVNKYFKLLADCNITPILVFDGGFDKSKRKLKTCVQRQKQNLTHVKKVAKTGIGGHVLPQLAGFVFRDVLGKLGITYQQCDYEADEYIASLANSLQCPVLSNDSDFFIFDVTCGFVRLDTVAKSVSYCSQTHSKYLECQIYSIDNFLSHFSGIDKSVLPLFATLLGNDYVDISTFDNFYENVSFPKFKSKLKVGQQHKRMICLLNWLKERTIQESIELIVSRLKANERKFFQSIIDQAINGYLLQQQPPMDGVRYLDIEPPTTCYGKELPHWFVERSRRGEIAPCLLSVIAVRCLVLSVQMEDPSMESSKSCSLYIRRVLYGIVTLHDTQHNSSSGDHVLEYCPNAGNIQKNVVEPLFSIDCYGKLPSLSELEDLDQENRMKLVSCVIGDVTDYFNLVPEHLHLFVGSVRYWLRHCIPKPTMEVFNALLITMFYFNTIKSLDGMPEFAAHIKKEEFQHFKERLKKYLKKTEHNNAKPFVISIVHCFTQFHTCLRYLISLTDLLGLPMAQIKMQNLLGGVLWYNLVVDLSTRKDPELFVLELLGRNSTLKTVFGKLKAMILENIPVGCIEKGKLHKNKSKKKTGKIAGVKVPICQWSAEVQLDDLPI